jgi:hypothetical protein
MKLSLIEALWITLALAIPSALGAQTTAPAQHLTPSAMSEQQGATSGLGESHRFRTSAAAADHCPGDTIVWLSGSKLIYLLPDAAKYGKGSGAYACRMEAEGAGFHSAGN